MILTVTINPLLEKKFIFNSPAFYQNNRDGKKVLSAGGKGINVSRQLNNLNIDNVALTFYGGNNGRIFKDILFREGIKSSLVHSASDMREAAVIVNESEKKISTFFEENSFVTEKEVEDFKAKLEKMIQLCELVVFSGSSPNKAADSIFPFGIKTANKYDKISLLDTYGEHLTDCLEAAPTIIHNNISELENSLKFSLKTDVEKRSFLFQLYKMGIKQAYLTNGAEASFISNFDYHFKINVPVIKAYDAAGSGDSFAAGIIYGWSNNLTFKDTAEIAAALGVINASRLETCTVKFEEIKLVKEKISLTSIGKKISLFDVNKD